MKILIVSILGLVILQITVDAQKISSYLPKAHECGKLNEAYFYNEKNNVEIDEYPWIGYIQFKRLETQETFPKCVAILISKRHLLTKGLCFDDMDNMEPTAVVLGTIADKVNCSTSRECGPEPQSYEIEDIGLHPNIRDKLNYDAHLKLHNIAIFRVAKDIEFNDYIRPICLPLNANQNTDLSSQYLPYAGYDLKALLKRKVVAHVRTLKSCKEIYKDFKGVKISEYNMCASCTTNITLATGSALMGVSTENEEPRFYLIGLMSAGAQKCSTEYPDVFIKISSYLEWIMYNLV